jgi:hypothetical protein
MSTRTSVESTHQMNARGLSDRSGYSHYSGSLLPMNRAMSRIDPK